MCTTDGSGSVESRLMDLIDRGYRFIHPRDAEGAVVAVVGVRPHDAVIDILRLDAENDATALRIPAEEEDLMAPSRTLWRFHGDAGEVLDELLALPDDKLTGSPAA